jgi:radical SAM protein with 4Fe4S-binding SPASM domain
MVELNLTLRCNGECRYCFSNASADQKGELDDSTWLRVLSDLAKTGILHLVISGGEPFLRPDLAMAIVKRALFEYGMSVEILSNGTLLTDDRIQELGRIYHSLDYKDRLYFQISCDGVGDFNDITRPGCRFARLDSVMKGLRRQGIPYTISTVVSRYNLAHLPAWFEYAWRELGAQAHKFMLVNPGGRAVDRYEDDLGLTIEEKIRVGVWGHKLNEFASKKGYKVVHPLYPLPLPFTLRAKEAKPKVRQAPPISRCQAAHYEMSITPDGYAVPCGWFLPYRNLFSEQRVTEAPISEIWEDANIFKEMRGKEVVGCRECPYSPPCNTGCRAHTYASTKDMTARDPSCILDNSELERYETLVNSLMDKKVEYEDLPTILLGDGV